MIETGWFSMIGTMMRPCDIDTSGEVWIFEPYDHKNRWRGHRKQIPLGPECQSIIAAFLARDSEAFVFSPKEAQEWRMERRIVQYQASRKTPVYPSELRAREKAKAARRKKTRKRPPRDRYDTDSYRKAIEYGFVKASKSGIVIPHWFPYQLRHTHATEIRKLYGIEAAQVTLGHARADVTEVYAEKNMEAAIRIAKEMG